MALTLAAVTNFALAQDAPKGHFSNNDTLGLITAVNLSVVDDVTDGCWTNKDTIEAKTRLLLEQNDIPVFTEDFEFYNVFHRRIALYAFGYRLSSGTCVASATFTATYWVYETLGGAEGGPEYRASNWAVGYERAYIMSGPKNLNGQLIDFFDQAASGFAADVLSARRSDVVIDFQANYPNHADTPMTQSRWKEFLKNVGSSE